MRVGTLEDPETLRFLSERFVLVTHNQLPELYCTSGTIDATSKKPYPKEQMARASEGAGGGNIRSYFCTPDGRVVNFVSGCWKPQRYCAEASWSLELIKKLPDKKELAQLHWHKAASYESQRNQFASPQEVERFLKDIASKPKSEGLAEQRVAMFRALAAFNRLIRSHREAREIVLMPIRQVLQKVEDEVYTKGAIGCDS